jgi:rubredoxin
MNTVFTAKSQPHTQSGTETMKKWECVVCGFIYDEAEGLPDEGIKAGTRWQDIPEDWECPDCGVSKADFEMVEMSA